MMVHSIASKYGQRPSTILRGSMRDLMTDLLVLESGIEAEINAREDAVTRARHDNARKGR